ncbi:hypothetical protein MRX96_047627 [Rhipicephalus microplus]
MGRRRAALARGRKQRRSPSQKSLGPQGRRHDAPVVSWTHIVAAIRRHEVQLQTVGRAHGVVFDNAIRWETGSRKWLHFGVFGVKIGVTA